MSYAETMESPDAAQWRAAQEEDITSLLKHGTFEVVDRRDGGVIRGGFSQREGDDYGETHSAVASYA
ncbi:hypothetical protein RI367_001545 [Sorochytrium milnesiophthora]